MRMIKVNWRALVLLTSVFCVLLSVGSCKRDDVLQGGSRGNGSMIRFTASMSGSDISSKSSYSGEISDSKERIDWEEGDVVRVYCKEASEPTSKYADYIVNSDVTDEGATSKATISGTGGIGLRWGSDNADHYFYAVYPSPSEGPDGEVFPGSSTATTMTGAIPAIQTPKSLNAEAAESAPNFTAEADLKSEYMVAYNKIKNIYGPDNHLPEDVVFLKFKPIVTAIEFTIKNDFTSDAAHPEKEILNIKNIQLTSASHNIAGTFTADLTGLDADGASYPECRSTSDGKTLTMDFTDIPEYDYSGNTAIGGSKKYIAVAKGQTLKFTFFLKPEYSGTPVKASDVNDLTFRINKADGSWVSTKLAYNDAEKTGVVFPCHKKSYVTGILVPEGAQWTVKYAPEVVSWNTEGHDISPVVGVSGDPFVTSWDRGFEEELDLGKRQKEPWLCFSAPTEHFIRTKGGFFQYRLGLDGEWIDFDGGRDQKIYYGGEKGSIYLRSQEAGNQRGIPVMGECNIGFIYDVDSGGRDKSRKADVSVSGDIMSLISQDLSITMADMQVDTRNDLSNLCGVLASFWTLKDASGLTFSTDYENRFLGVMFMDCINLTEPPVLPATEKSFDFHRMFERCTSLTKAPELPATILTTDCYSGMFAGCTSLAKAPELPATTMAQGCYEEMFMGCTSLTEAPELPATTLAFGCYCSMFENCTSLTEAPELPAATLVSDCYAGMFAGCSSLKSIKIHATAFEQQIKGDEWEVTLEDCLYDWCGSGYIYPSEIPFSASGTFYKKAGLDYSSGTSGIPEGWTVVEF